MSEQAELSTKIEQFLATADSLAPAIEQMRQASARAEEALTYRTQQDDDVGVMKGAYIRNAILNDIDGLAEGLGYAGGGVAYEQAVVKALGDHLRGTQTAVKSEVDSFKRADLVMLARDSAGQVYNCVVEISFTVDERDIIRAARNAGFMSKVTTIPSVAAVAGVRITREAEELAQAEGVKFYAVDIRDIQAE